ncbi:MAG: phage tail sheath family protein [Saccharothrix sp.]|nr:phage tail sheath family protein [Saccharothrix sp.]
MPGSDAPGVYVSEHAAGARAITAVDTSTPAFLGYTGAFVEHAVPRRIGGWWEFRDHYGVEATARQLAQASDPAEIRALRRRLTLAEAVYGFFANGGTSCCVVGFTDPRRAVSPAELRGDADARTGLAGLEAVPEVTMVAVPSLWDMTADVSSAEEEPTPDHAAGVERIAEVVDHCTRLDNRVAILDPPPGLTPDRVAAFADRLGPRDTDVAAFTTLYYPWITVPGVDDVERTVPSCGHVAGVWARTDAERGVSKAPANENLRGVRKLDAALTDEDNRALNEAGVNCLRAFPDRGPLVWGARTRSSARDWRHLNVRRLVSHLADSIRRSTTWAIFTSNDERLRTALRDAIVAHLSDQWRKGVLVGHKPDEAFFVICDGTNNTAETGKQGIVVCDLGVAPVRPGEFVHFTVTQQAGHTG